VAAQRLRHDLISLDDGECFECLVVERRDCAALVVIAYAALEARETAGIRAREGSRECCASIAPCENRKALIRRPPAG
jgi:hypothetical protein